uniref:General transcription factor IIH subunit 4 n=1 Tax=Rhabditophanes sp. KR3021 TaxID=114890 RepID=A0AC35U041_9BILA
MELNHEFKANYLTGVMKGNQCCVDLEIAELLDKKAKRTAKKDLSGKANERWECILKYLALPSEQSAKEVSSGTKVLFGGIGFVRTNERDIRHNNSGTEITSTGFQFLLLNRVEQLWTYVLEYFRFNKNSEIFECFEFLLKLTLLVNFNNEGVKDLKNAGTIQSLIASKGSDNDDGSDLEVSQMAFSTVTKKKSGLQMKAYKINDNWSEKLKGFFSHLRELGLIFTRKSKDGFFFLTPLLNNLAVPSTSIENMQEANKNAGFIMVESNYRIYAYSNNVLQLTILSAFTEMLYRFEDLAVGVLTRESVRRAMSVGITSKQIITFLRANSKQEAVEKYGSMYCVPVTISDQLSLWEQERQRITSVEAFYMENFDSNDEFKALYEFCKESDLLLWANADNKTLIAKATGQKQIKDFMIVYKEQQRY